MDQIEIRSPKTEAEWKKYDDFRWEILRKPLNIPHIPLKDDLEDRSYHFCLLYTSPSPRDVEESRMPSSA